MKTMNKKQKLMTRLLNEINEQREWIEQCGASLLGYLRRYGDASKDKNFYGNGGRAIYDADTNALHKLEEELRKVKDSLRLSNERS